MSRIPSGKKGFLARVLPWVALLEVAQSLAKQQDRCHCEGPEWYPLQESLRGQAVDTEFVDSFVNNSLVKVQTEKLNEALRVKASRDGFAATVSCAAGVVSTAVLLSIYAGSHGDVNGAWRCLSGAVGILLSQVDLTCFDSSPWPFTVAEIFSNHRELTSLVYSCPWETEYDHVDLCVRMLSRWDWVPGSSRLHPFRLGAGDLAMKRWQATPFESPTRALASYAWWIEQGISNEALYWKSHLDLQRDIGTRWLKAEVTDRWAYLDLCSFIAGTKAPRVLNAGSGPIVPKGLTCDGEAVPVVSVDGLAHLYWRLYDNLDLVPPQLPVQCDFEEITACFTQDYFHLIHVRNALDHAFDAPGAILQLVHALRPGGTLLLHHARNEADSMKGVGMHRWSFDVDESLGSLRCILKFRGGEWSIDLEKVLRGLASVSVGLHTRQELNVTDVDRPEFVFVTIVRH
ncbi:unnamed protein product [Polarella glacialis]|uniref:Methyltransferase type 11 domain-containing protein n=1 Tax=Polarella glacialis TaxID=89957 RepID=A0A813LLC4_POLGL|nr:unnamed protein product [Polarella glacialis]